MICWEFKDVCCTAKLIKQLCQTCENSRQLTLKKRFKQIQIRWERMRVAEREPFQAKVARIWTLCQLYLVLVFPGLTQIIKIPLENFELKINHENHLSCISGIKNLPRPELVKIINYLVCVYSSSRACYNYSN